MGNTWNTVQLLAHFLFQWCWMWVVKTSICMWDFCLIGKGETTAQCWESEWDFEKQIWSSWGLMQFLQNVVWYIIGIPKATSGISRRPACAWMFLVSRFWSVSITHIRKLASWKSLTICQGKISCKWWHCISFLYSICNAVTLTYFPTCENEEFTQKSFFVGFLHMLCVVWLAQ